MSAAPFLAAKAGEAGAVVIQGAPYEGGVSWRPGAVEGPRGIRLASDSLETYSPRARRDLADVDLTDAGDLALTGLSPKEAIARIAEATAAYARAGAAVVTLGGDHSVSIGTSRGLRTVHQELTHVVFDAHFDLRATYDGSELSHACGTRHMAAAGPTCVLGVRSGERGEFDDASTLLTAWSDDVEVPDVMRDAIAGRPIFVSVDLDVLDPATFPGTGNPEAGGPSYPRLLDAIASLAGARVVGIDITECAPPLDPTGLSPVVAAKLARDAICALLSSDAARP